jgi:hypothetical protein
MTIFPTTDYSDEWDGDLHTRFCSLVPVLCVDTEK